MLVRARFALALALALSACGGHKGPVSVVPLPDDPPAPTEPVAETKPTPPPATPPAEEPDAPLPPLDMTIPAVTPTIKLVSGGKGKKSPLGYGLKVGAKQAVQLVLGLDTSFTDPTTGKGESSPIPTMVLDGDSEITAVDADGTAAFKYVVSKVTARDVTNEEVDAAKFQQMLALTVTGLVMTGTVAANGNLGPTLLHADKSDMATPGALGLIQIAMPRWPLLPKEPVAVGAKWTATYPSALQEQIVITVTTTYELTERTATSWTVKSTTAITGTDQTIATSTLTKIGGTGSSTVTATDGALFPTATSALETQFTAQQQGKTMSVDYKTTGAFGSPTASPASPTPAHP